MQWTEKFVNTFLALFLGADYHRLMTELELKAKEFATNAHKGQKRKYTGVDYITHPAEVVDILRSIDADEYMLAAGWLHDVVEDCGVSIDTILEVFGPHVAAMVADLTDVSKPSDGNRAFRKSLDLQHSKKALPKSKTIKLADLVSNTASIVKYDPEFAKVYLPEKKALLKVLIEGNSTLFKRACEQINCLDEQ